MMTVPMMIIALTTIHVIIAISRFLRVVSKDGVFDVDSHLNIRLDRGLVSFHVANRLENLILIIAR